MMDHLQLLSRLSRPAESKIVLLVLDGVGDIKTLEQPSTALETASLPNLDALAKTSALGRIVPVAQGITPGSGPGHLALFGYDPMKTENDIGRGVLEALGLELELGPDEVAARGNFATADSAGNLTDRRAGRISNEENRRLCALLREALAGQTDPEVRVESGEGYRFVLLLDGDGLSAALHNTDPQAIGVPPRAPSARLPEAEATRAKLVPILERMEQAIANEPRANRVLLRGFSKLPALPSMEQLYKLRCGAFAGYPLYRGVAKACGMEVVPCSKSLAEMVDVVRDHWDRFDYFFLHIKGTDAAGEDGDLGAKVAVLEEVDEALPALLALEPDVLAVTGDHSTPVPMKLHSWHPVPLMIRSDHCFVDGRSQFTEGATRRGHLGTFASRELMGLLLANAGRLAKYGA